MERVGDNKRMRKTRLVAELCIDARLCETDPGVPTHILNRLVPKPKPQARTREQKISESIIRHGTYALFMMLIIQVSKAMALIIMLTRAATVEGSKGNWPQSSM